MLKELTIEITQKCPNRCIYCSSLSDRTKDLSIDFELIKSVVTQGRECGLKEISISGGEPLTSPHLMEIVKFAFNRDIRSSIYTTGCYFEDKSIKPYIDWHFFKHFFPKLIFNIQSINPEIHDSLSGRKCSFNDSIFSLKSAIDYQLDVEVHIMPNKQNLSSIVDTVKYLCELGVKKISFLRLVSQGRAKDNIERLTLSFDEKEVLNSKFKKIESLNLKTILRFGIPFSNGFHKEKICTAGTEKLIIRYDGKILPCEAFKDSSLNHFVLGDIRSDSISKVLASTGKLLFDLKKEISTGNTETCPAQLLYESMG